MLTPDEAKTVRLEFRMPESEVRRLRALAVLEGLTRVVGGEHRGCLAKLLRRALESPTKATREQLRKHGADLASLVDVEEPVLKVPVRVTPDEREKLHRLAVRHGLHTSAFIRALLRLRLDRR